MVRYQQSVVFICWWLGGASTPRLFDGVIHGVLTWCLVTLFTVYLLTTAVGRIIGGASSLVSGIVKTAGSGIAATAPGLADEAQKQLKKNGVDLDLNDLKSEVNQLLRETGKAGLQPNALERQAARATRHRMQPHGPPRTHRRLVKTLTELLTRF